jgi:hypothetical protein
MNLWCRTVRCCVSKGYGLFPLARCSQQGIKKGCFQSRWIWELTVFGNCFENNPGNVSLRKMSGAMTLQVVDC